MILAIAKGVAIGFAVSVPLGPVAAVAIRSALRRDRRTAWALAAGSAAIDAVYAVLAYVGVAGIVAAEPRAMRGLWVVGGVVLLVLGVQGLRERAAAPEARAADPAGLARAFGLGALLTATNPAAILLWMGMAGTVFAGVGIERMCASATGVAIGGAGWLALVTEAAFRGGARGGPRAAWVIRGIGALLVAAGLWALRRALAG